MRATLVSSVAVAAALTAGATASVVTNDVTHPVQPATPATEASGFGNTPLPLNIIKNDLTAVAGQFDAAAPGEAARRFGPAGDDVWMIPAGNSTPTPARSMAGEALRRSPSLTATASRPALPATPPLTPFGKVPSTGILHPLVVPAPGAMALLAVTMIVAGTRRRASS